MAQDKNSQEQIETILYHFGVRNSGEAAKQIHEEIVKPLEEYKWMYENIAK